MDLNVFDIYLIMTADNVGGIFTFLKVAMGLIFAIAFFTFLVSTPALNNHDKDATSIHSAMATYIVNKKYVATWLLVIFLSAFTPSTKTLVAMYGIPMVISTAKNLVDNNTVTEVAKTSANAIMGLMNEYVDSVTPKK